MCRVLPFVNLPVTVKIGMLCFILFSLFSSFAFDSIFLFDTVFSDFVISSFVIVVSDTSESSVLFRPEDRGSL